VAALTKALRMDSSELLRRNDIVLSQLLLAMVQGREIDDLLYSARLGTAWLGTARRGAAWQGLARHG
jgi:hypothetical protein